MSDLPGDRAKRSRRPEGRDVPHGPTTPWTPACGRTIGRRLLASIYGAKFAAMRYATSIEPITVLKTKSAELVRRTRRSGEPIIITQNGRAAAVLQDVETFERQRRALLLLRFLAEGQRQLNQRRGIDGARAIRRLRRRIEGLRGAGAPPA
ncbi:MAG: type II toxin-antitoxin system Phd/YefM family antitoxin [Deltaproteobacteria bacterium]|nr:MAG: type II toxin-antitoxin system Phd/YefM family antitoxin [Deltaproteobacteria bacterium]